MAGYVRFIQTTIVPDDDDQAHPQGMMTALYVPMHVAHGSALDAIRYNRSEGKGTGVVYGDRFAAEDWSTIFKDFPERQEDPSGSADEGPDTDIEIDSLEVVLPYLEQ